MPRLHRQQIALHNVANKSEVARLTTIAIKRWALTAEQAGDEQWNHCRVRTGRILAWAEHVEVTQADGFQTEAMVKGLQIQLAGKFGGRVRTEHLCKSVSRLAE